MSDWFFKKKILPVAPIYRMIKYYLKSQQLSKIYNFDYVIYNNAIYGLIHAFFKNNVVGMINDYNNQKNISTGFGFNYGFIKKLIFKFFEKKAIKYQITASDFKDAVSQTVITTSSDATRPVLTGVFWHSFNGFI